MDLSYELSTDCTINIVVGNVAGQLVRNLLDEYQMTGRKVSAGLYFYQLQAPNRTVTRRMALVK